MIKNNTMIILTLASRISFSRVTRRGDTVTGIHAGSSLAWKLLWAMRLPGLPNVPTTDVLFLVLRISFSFLRINVLSVIRTTKGIMAVKISCYNVLESTICQMNIL